MIHRKYPPTSGHVWQESISRRVTGNYTLNLDIDLQLYTSETCSMKEKNNNKDYMTNIRFVTNLAC